MEPGLKAEPPGPIRDCLTRKRTDFEKYKEVLESAYIIVNRDTAVSHQLDHVDFLIHWFQFQFQDADYLLMGFCRMDNRTEYNTQCLLLMKLRHIAILLHQ